jgi:HemY protein
MKLRRPWLIAGVALLLLAGGAVTLRQWQHRQQLTQTLARLPAPDLTGYPEELRQRVAAARAKVKSAADPLQAVAELGRLYQANDIHAAAEACWAVLREREPQNARWPYYLAHLRRAASDYPAMEELLERTVALAPDYAPAWLQLADYRFKTGRMDAARAGYERRLALVPKDPYAQLGLVRLALQQRRTDEARAALETLLADNPQFSTAHNLYAEILASAGRAEEAASHRLAGRETGRYREADDPWLAELTAYCYDYARLCNLATIQQQVQQGDRGQALLRRAIALRPGDPTAYEQLGSLFLQQNDAAQARTILEEGLARARDPKPSTLCYVNLSRAYRTLKQPAEAVRVARLGLAEAGEEFELYDALGSALGETGEREAAVEALRAAVARNPRDANANFNLAIALVAVRRLDEAVEALHRSLVLEPTFPSSLAMLAQIEIDSGRWENAAQYILPLYESHPERPQARALMTEWHLRSGKAAEEKQDLAAAERHYRAGAAIDHNSVELSTRLGTLLLMQGRFADAIAPLENNHRLQPANAQSSLFLGQAYAATGRVEEARRVLMEGVQAAERAGNATTAQYCREILQQLR